MTDKKGVEQQHAEEYVALASQSVRAIGGRLKDVAELAQGVKYSPFAVANIFFADGAESETIRFSISYDFFFARMVYNFLPDGTVIKTGMIIDGMRKIHYSKDDDRLPDRVSNFQEVVRNPLPVGLDELRNVTQVIQDPGANVDLVALLPRLPSL